jgi:hypothetical protein
MIADMLQRLCRSVGKGGGRKRDKHKPPTAQQFIDHGSMKRVMRVTVKRELTRSRQRREWSCGCDGALNAQVKW